MSYISKEKYISTFYYKVEDFRLNIYENDSESQFDLCLKEKWNAAITNNVFKYILHIKESKILKGQFQFLVQLNLERISNRRKPEDISSVNQPFDSNKFNFTKLPEREIYFDIENGDGNNVIVVNVSPFEWGHCLFVPERFYQLPQKITKYSLQKVIEFLLISSSPNLRIVFNGLCAHASINHLHWHLYYLKHRMLLETIELDSLNGPICILKNYPAKGFCVKLSLIPENNIKELINITYLIVRHLQNKEIAHNVYITRAKSIYNKESFDDVRIYIWARKSNFGIKGTSSFIPGVCELFGHLVIGSEEAYKNLTEETIAKILNEITSDVMSSVCDEIKVCL